MAQIPDTRTLTSKDGKRMAVYKRVPEGWAGRRTAYRLIRTQKSRRGFGIIIHTITTFAPSKQQAACSAAHWVRVRVKDR